MCLIVRILHNIIIPNPIIRIIAVTKAEVNC